MISVGSLVATAVLALALIGCGGLSAGDITATRHDAAYDVQYTVDGDCTLWGWEVYGFNKPMSWVCMQHEQITKCCHHIPDKWFVQVRGNCKPTDDPEVVKCDIEWKEVTQDFYNAAVAGQVTWYGPTPVPTEAPAKGH